MLTPIVIDDVQPRTPGGFAAKAVSGQAAARVGGPGGRRARPARRPGVRWRPRRRATTGGRRPCTTRGNSRWEGSITPTEIGAHELVIDAWTDRYATWRHEIDVKVAAGQDVELELEEGALLLEDAGRQASAGRRTRDRLQAAADGDPPHELHPRRPARRGRRRRGRGAREHVARHARSRRRPAPAVGRPARRGPRRLVRAVPPLLRRASGAPRSTSPYVADLGFDVVYLPPIHPIGLTHRKGRDNSLTAGRPTIPGARGRSDRPTGGHDAVDPDARHDGGLRRPRRRRRPSSASRSRSTTRCSAAPTTPGCASHPEWFTQRPDGSIRYAENPPKKYQDIHPIKFWPAEDADRIALWAACRDVLEHWIAHGVRTFRVDNPHTKPLRVLGLGDRRGPRAATPTSCSSPRPSPTPP